jgi:hypothetical protein
LLFFREDKKEKNNAWRVKKRMLSRIYDWNLPCVSIQVLNALW